VGEENIVQIVTYNAANYMATDGPYGWADHCLDLMLNDFGKLIG
jgi:hypothetical protein